MEQGRALEVVRLGRVDYARALRLQEDLVLARQADAIADTLILLEHPPVYTLGRGADPGFILDRSRGVPILRVSRGGQVTWHGPGQLVGYPILKLLGVNQDVHRYIRALEECLITTLRTFAIEAERRSGLTGVWVDNRKIASIGIGIRRWVTLHGFALNVDPDLSYFDAIVPCGIADCRMTSISRLSATRVTTEMVLDELERAFAVVFGFGRIEYRLAPLSEASGLPDEGSGGIARG